MGRGAEKADRSTSNSLQALLDVPLRVTVEIGSMKLTIADLLELRVGQTIGLDQLADEPLVVKAGGKTIARGMAIEVNGKVAVRITEIIGESIGRDADALPKTG